METMEKSSLGRWIAGVVLVLGIALLGVVAWQPELLIGTTSLKVVVEPAEALRAGAQWRLATEWRQESQLDLGTASRSLFVEFKEVAGWIPPQPVLVPQGRGEQLVQVQYQRRPLAEKTILRIHGSNTIGENMAPEWAQRYLRSLGADEVRVVRGNDPVEKNVEGIFSQRGELLRIEIKAHGSSTSFKSLKAGAADIGMSSRRIKEEEREWFLHLGDFMTPEHEYVVALDGLAIIVNRANSLDRLTRKQVADIFAGRITDWSALGLPPGPINLYARDDKSGTFDTFQHLVLGKDKLAPHARRFESTSELSNAVAADPQAIGFCGLPYIDKSKELAIQDEGLPIKPSPFSVSTEDYPLARRLYLYAPKHAPGSHGERFLAFVLSRDGQDGVTKHGFVSLDIASARMAKAPVPTTAVPSAPAAGDVLGTSAAPQPAPVQVAASPSTPPEDPLRGIVFTNHAVGEAYRRAVLGGERLPINFRFEFGSFVLDSKAVRDLDRVAEVMKTTPGRQLVLVGFSDSVGDYGRNLELSRRRAEAVADGLRQRGVNISALVAAGEEAPVASNDDPIGRERNRRVEVWLR